MQVPTKWAIAVLIAAFLGAMLAHLGAQANLDDDRAYLYTAGLAVSAPERFDAYSEEWRKRLSTGGYHEESLARFDFRHDYVANYAAQSVVIAGIRTGWPWRTSGLDYPHWLRLVVAISGVLLAAFGAGLAIWMFARLDEDQKRPAMLGFLTLAALSFFPVLLFYRISSSIDLLYPMRALFLLVQPGHELTPFGVQNRNVATMLLVAATFARWRGATATAYWIIFGAATMHATYGAIMLLLMLALDVALQPRKLWKPAVLVPIAATAVWGGLFGVSFDAFATPFVPLALFAGLVGVVLVAGLAPLERLPPVRVLRGLPPRWGEAVVLFSAVASLLLAVAVAASLTEGLQRVYVVDELSGRPLALLRVPLLLALAAIILAMLPDRLVKLVVMAAVAGAIACVPAGLALFQSRWKPTPSEAEILAALPTQDAQHTHASSDTERAVYYSIAYAIDSAQTRAGH